MMASQLVVACLIAVVIFAVPCLSLSRIACNNVKQGMDVTGTVLRFFLLAIIDYSQVACAPRIRPKVCATLRTRCRPCPASGCLHSAHSAALPHPHNCRASAAKLATTTRIAIFGFDRALRIRIWEFQMKFVAEVVGPACLKRFKVFASKPEPGGCAASPPSNLQHYRRLSRTFMILQLRLLAVVFHRRPGPRQESHRG
jgi:hypothetical protein